VPEDQVPAPSLNLKQEEVSLAVCLLLHVKLLQRISSSRTFISLHLCVPALPSPTPGDRDDGGGGWISMSAANWRRRGAAPQQRTAGSDQPPTISNRSSLWAAPAKGGLR